MSGNFELLAKPRSALMSDSALSALVIAVWVGASMFVVVLTN